MHSQRICNPSHRVLPIRADEATHTDLVPFFWVQLPTCAVAACH